MDTLKAVSERLLKRFPRYRVAFGSNEYPLRKIRKNKTRRTRAARRRLNQLDRMAFREAIQQYDEMLMDGMFPMGSFDFDYNPFIYDDVDHDASIDSFCEPNDFFDEEDFYDDPVDFNDAWIDEPYWVDDDYVF